MKFGQFRPRLDGSGQALTVKVHQEPKVWEIQDRSSVTEPDQDQTKRRNPGPLRPRTKYFFSLKPYEIFENLELHQK